MTILLSASSDLFHTNVFGNYARSDPVWLLQNELAAQRRDQPGSGKDNVRMFNQMLNLYQRL
ncbi:hypothetical protein [Pantoea vagans]|uniref:hypothetical protein n=1 Tax=Pantoea vagans TaxID=470934 RepID=UPI0023B0DE3D|nr:hypothetical protein [Pantoea vagans]MDE8558516.1 hypothetical protein [Pantoea vagans]MDE8578562.1 hypothetical protein [Pantoea vagans]